MPAVMRDFSAQALRRGPQAKQDCADIPGGSLCPAALLISGQPQCPHHGCMQVCPESGGYLLASQPQTSTRRSSKAYRLKHACRLKQAYQPKGWRFTCILLLRSLRAVRVDCRVVVGPLLRASMHGVLRVLAIRVLCQVAGCIRNVVHAACRHQRVTFSNSSSSSPPRQAGV